MPTRTQISQQEYQTLSEFRYLIRRFLEFSEVAARKNGLTARQHQALLAIKGFPRDDRPTVGDLAERLRIQHHGAVELVDRLVKAGLVVRTHGADDRRRVQLNLTPFAEKRLAALSASHLEELHRLRPGLLQIIKQVGNRAASPLRLSPVARIRIGQQP